MGDLMPLYRTQSSVKLGAIEDIVSFLEFKEFIFEKFVNSLEAVQWGEISKHSS